MPKPSQADVQFFQGVEASTEVAAQLLGKEFRDRKAAAEAIATLAADPDALRDLLAHLPGGALEALRTLSEERVPFSEAALTARLEGHLGKGHGAAAFQALRGRGFLGVTDEHFPRFQIWKPLHGPIGRLLAGVDVVAAPDGEASVGPDRSGLAIALLLGHLWRTRPKVKRDGALYKKEAAELDRIFGPTLGAGVAEKFVRAFQALGLGRLSVTERDTMASFQFAPAGDAAAFLARPRAERVRAFAECCVLPRWLVPAFAADENLASRQALHRAARRQMPPPDPSEFEEPVGYCLAAGILEELPGGLRASAELRGRPAPERPSGGRWLVQPNLELVVPPDVPLPDAFRLACFAEVASLDRAAVLRVTPASLALAAEGGLRAEEVERRLAARAGAPVPELVIRAVRDGVRPRSAVWIHTGTVVVAPEEARESVRACLDRLAGEIAPGVFLVDELAERKLGKALASLDVLIREPSTAYDLSDAEDREVGAEHLRELLGTPVVGPADARLVAAIERARSGQPGAFECLAPPQAATHPRPPSPARPGGPAGDGLPDVNDLLDELVARADRGIGLDPVLVPPAERQQFFAQLEKVLKGKVEPERFGPGFVRLLVRLLGGNRGPAAPPAVSGDGALPSVAPPGAKSEAAAPPPLDPAWKLAAARAMAERRDLWIGLATERRPRLVTPHRVVRRGEEADLLALTHDSGDLRVFPGERITGAAVGGPSDAAHLPGAAATNRPALRAARNERCPCGSGKKYKACCLPADLAAAG